LLLDSRKLIFPDSSVFFALNGPRRSGISFIPDLYERGVRNFVVSTELSAEQYPEANILLVPDTLVALQELAASHRGQFDIPVIGITGSNGKTIVKEWLNQLLEDRYNIVRSPRSYNSQIGVPLSVWQMNEKNELGIFEAGISKPQEMSLLEKIIRPTVGVFTNIGEAHNEGFENQEQKIMEKLGLFVHSEGLIYNQDQEAVNQAVRSWQRGGTVKIFSWGKQEDANMRVASVNRRPDHTLLDIIHQKAFFTLRIAFTSDAAIENALTCIAVMLFLGENPAGIQPKLDRLSPVAMRLELKTGVNHCSVINDSYSTDMSSFRIALDFLSQQQQHEKRTVILSDILESGRDDKSLYEEVAWLLAKNKVSRLVGIGERIGAYRQTLDKSLREPGNYYRTTEAFLRDAGTLVFRDESILIKGARIFGFEKIDQLLSLQAHQTVLEVSLEAMANNLKAYQQLLKPATRVMAMVKAFSYGTGSYEIARLLEFNKVDYLAVAYVDEGVELRRSGIRLPIMVMNTEEESLEAMLEHQLEPVIYSFGILTAIDHFFRKQAVKEYPVHVELETGMNRLGFALKDLDVLTSRISSPSFKVRSVYSHLAASEEAQQDAFTQRQADLFLLAAEKMQQQLGYPFLKHIANSAAIVRSPELQMDMVRLGIGLYGVDSSESHRLSLRHVGTLKSTIAQIKELGANETVGYNRKGIVNGYMKMATVRIGYADGYPRILGNGNGKIWVKGRLVPTVGSICMDMTMIDITGIEDVYEGDEVVIFGEELPVQQVAHWAGTIAYEILTGISQRVKRLYFE
jgi:Alr-MurF fusion protein